MAAETIAEVEPETQVQIMNHLPDETATDILEAMEPDEAADLLDDLPNARSNETARIRWNPTRPAMSRN